MVKGIGIVLEKVGERKGTGRASIEIWVGRVEECPFDP
jgi:hypothetical protein